MRQTKRRVLRLRKLRREREMTQEQLAKRVGLKTSTIGLIEQGRSRPSFDKALAIARVFGEPVEQLFEYVEVPR